MRVLIVNFATDPRDPLLGFTTEWARSIGSHFEESLVLSGRVGAEAPTDLEVRSLGWEQGRSLSNLVRLEYRFSRGLRAFRPDVIFVHMAAAYAAFIGPIARAHSIPLVLWYEHQATSWELKLAERWASAVVSASPSYPGRRSSTVVGHGIDPGEFAPPKHLDGARGSDLLNAVHVGRGDPIKRVDRLVEALAAARNSTALDYRFTQVGSPSGVASNGGLMASADLSKSWMTWKSNLAKNEIAAEYRRHDFFIHARIGSLDKAPLEACMSGLPVLTEGPNVFRALGAVGDPPPLEDQLRQLSELDSKELSDFVSGQREFVLSNHSLPKTAERIANVLKAQVHGPS